MGLPYLRMVVRHTHAAAPDCVVFGTPICVYLGRELDLVFHQTQLLRVHHNLILRQHGSQVTSAAAPLTH